MWLAELKDFYVYEISRLERSSRTLEITHRPTGSIQCASASLPDQVSYKDVLRASEPQKIRLSSC